MSKINLIITRDIESAKSDARKFYNKLLKAEVNCSFDLASLSVRFNNFTYVFKSGKSLKIRDIEGCNFNIIKGSSYVECPLTYKRLFSRGNTVL